MRLQIGRKHVALSCGSVPLFSVLLCPLALSLQPGVAQKRVPQAATLLRPLLPDGEIILKAVKLVSGAGVFTRHVTVTTIQRPQGSVEVKFFPSGSASPPFEAVAEVKVFRMEEQTTWQVNTSAAEASTPAAEKVSAARCDRAAEQFCAYIAQQRPLPKQFLLDVKAEASQKHEGKKNGFTVFFSPAPDKLDSASLYRISAEGAISQL